MARGKRTDPMQAALVMVMADLGFEPGMIAEVAGLPRGTVNDIVQRKGPWCTTPENELIERTRVRLIQAIDSAAYDLGMAVLAKLDEKINTASFPELMSILGASMVKGAVQR